MRADDWSAWRPARAEDLEEERRLAFVGMTRAEDQLTLSCARRRAVRGMRVSQAASPFLDEIGSKGVDAEDLTTERRAVPAARGGFYEDIEQRRIIEATADADERAPPEYEHLRAGCRVSHPQFGCGTVRRLSQQWPETRVDVLSRTTLEILDGPARLSD